MLLLRSFSKAIILLPFLMSGLHIVAQDVATNPTGGAKVSSAQKTQTLAIDEALSLRILKPDGTIATESLNGFSRSDDNATYDQATYIYLGQKFEIYLSPQQQETVQRKKREQGEDPLSLSDLFDSINITLLGGPSAVQVEPVTVSSVQNFGSVKIDPFDKDHFKKEVIAELPTESSILVVSVHMKGRPANEIFRFYSKVRKGFMFKTFIPAAYYIFNPIDIVAKGIKDQNVTAGDFLNTSSASFGVNICYWQWCNYEVFGFDSIAIGLPVYTVSEDINRGKAATVGLGAILEINDILQVGLGCELGSWKLDAIIGTKISAILGKYFQ